MQASPRPFLRIPMLPNISMQVELRLVDSMALEVEEAD